jgi:prolyl-tRNA synthetase
VLEPLEFASETEVNAAAGALPGSVGPVGLQMPMVVDPEAAALADFACGANRDGYHYHGVNWDRDVALDETRIVDIRNVVAGDKAPNEQGVLAFLRGIEVGHIFQLGSIYSEPMQATVLDQNGHSVAPIMGCYGIGITRLVASVVEQNHDAGGICWPQPVAPAQVHILALNYTKSDTVREAADELYARCQDAGIETLIDDRDERPGVKFADADLIGIPHRITVGERGLKEGNVEYRRRTEPDLQAVPFDDVLAKLQ